MHPAPPVSSARVPFVALEHRPSGLPTLGLLEVNEEKHLRAAHAHSTASPPTLHLSRTAGTPRPLPLFFIAIALSPIHPCCHRGFPRRGPSAPSNLFLPPPPVLCPINL